MIHRGEVQMMWSLLSALWSTYGFGLPFGLCMDLDTELGFPHLVGEFTLAGGDHGVHVLSLLSTWGYDLTELISGWLELIEWSELTMYMCHADVPPLQWSEKRRSFELARGGRRFAERPLLPEKPKVLVEQR